MADQLTTLRATLKRAYDLGWIEAARWANRGDLTADIDSPAYLADSTPHIEKLIASMEAQPEPIAVLSEALAALEVAQDNLRPHGDNCFLHDSGEYASCFCGKDSVESYLQDVVEKLANAIAHTVQPASEPKADPVQEPIGNAQSLTDDLMDCVDRLGSEAETVDKRVWGHLRVYLPVHPVEQHKPTGWVAPKDRYAVPVLFNPYTGEPRDVRDLQSDPQGILIVPPGKVEMLASKKPPPVEPPATCGTCKHFKQGKNQAVGVYEMACFECSQYYPDKYEARTIEQAHGIEGGAA